MHKCKHIKRTLTDAHVCIRHTRCYPHTLSISTNRQTLATDTHASDRQTPVRRENTVLQTQTHTRQTYTAVMRHTKEHTHTHTHIHTHTQTHTACRKYLLTRFDRHSTYAKTVTKTGLRNCSSKHHLYAAITSPLMLSYTSTVNINHTEFHITLSTTCTQQSYRSKIHHTHHLYSTITPKLMSL